MSQRWYCWLLFVVVVVAAAVTSVPFPIHGANKKEKGNPYYYRPSLTFAETWGSCLFQSGSIGRGAPATSYDLGLWACSTSESPTTTAAPHGSVLCASSLSGANSATLPLLYR